MPGDIVGFEAGDKVAADGRILVAATLEIEEAGLTGESTPVAKIVDPVTEENAPLGDRVDMAYMNSQVTRGRGEIVVTATGMSSEVGHISGMLSGVEQEKSPLTKQLDQLTVIITIMAAGALALIIILGLARGEDFDSLFLTGITLAIAAIPTGLPAVVTMLLSVGTQQLADKGAIVKRLKSVETLGSTSAICSDKTGTLTLNQMTARELVIVGRRFSVDGEGYSTIGQHPAGGGHRRQLARAVHAADGARQRRRHPRRGVHRRSDGGRPRRPRRQRWAGRRRDPQDVSPRGRGAVRRRVQADGDVPRDGRRRAQGRALLRQGCAGRPVGALVALSRR